MIRRHLGIAAVSIVLAATTLALGGCGNDDDADSVPPTAGTPVPATTMAATTTLTPAASTTPTSTAPASTAPASTVPPPATATTSPPPSSTTDPAIDVHEVRVYFLMDEVVTPVQRTVEGDGVALGAARELVRGPSDAERARGLSSTIPVGTQVLGLTIEGATAVVDLSAEFASGGGTASMMGRAAQVVFTLTQFPNVEAVEFRIEGESQVILGGEGIEIEGPQRREDWETFSPAILIESPLPDAAVSSPLRVVGTANTFEAMFRLSITDATGALVFDGPARATSGTGTRGTFDVTIRFDGAASGAAQLTAYESSAQDGSPINVVTVPVELS